MTTPRPSSLAALAVVLGLVPGCGSKDPEPEAPYRIEKSYIDDNPKPRPPKPEPAAAEPESPEPAATPPTEPEPEPEPESQPADEAPERELVAERQSRSSLGRTRDMARDLRSGLQGGAAPSGEIASTTDQDMWIEVGDLHWDVPLAWSLVIPSNPAIKGELLVENQLGNAQVLFREDPRPASAIVRDPGVTVLDDIGDAIRPSARKAQVAGHAVHRFTMAGTMVPPRGNELPFWTVRGVVIERPGQPAVVVLMLGPDQTMLQNQARWEGMIEGMTTR